MALPVLNPPSENKNLDRIRESLRSNQAANDPGFSRTSTPNQSPTRIPRANRQAANDASFERVRGQTQAAHEKAVKGINPLVPLLTEMNAGIRGIHLTLVDMTGVIRSTGRQIVKAIEKLQIGRGAANDDDWGLGRRQRSQS